MSVITLAIRSGMQTWRNSPASDRWNRSQTRGCRRTPSTGNKRLPTWVSDRQWYHQPREWEDRLWNKLRKVTYFGQNFSITPYIQTSSPIQPLSENCCQPWINDVMNGYTHVFDEDLFNLGHYNLITLTIKLIGCWPIKLRAYCTPLWIRKVVNDMIKAGDILIMTCCMKY